MCEREKKGCTTSRTIFKRSNLEIQKRRYVFETHAKIVYGVETYTVCSTRCEYNLFFAIALHLIRSLACRLRKIHKTDIYHRTHQFHVSSSFFLFSFSVFIFRNIPKTGYMHASLRGDIFLIKNSGSTLIFLGGIMHLYRMRFLVSFF